MITQTHTQTHSHTRTEGHTHLQYIIGATAETQLIVTLFVNCFEQLSMHGALLQSDTQRASLRALQTEAVTKSNDTRLHCLAWMSFTQILERHFSPS